jgi:hypothetical protein
MKWLGLAFKCGGSALWVAIQLWYLAGKIGWSAFDASYATLAQDFNDGAVSADTIRRGVKALEKAGLIKTARAEGNNTTFSLQKLECIAHDFKIWPVQGTPDSGLPPGLSVASA